MGFTLEGGGPIPAGPGEATQSWEIAPMLAGTQSGGAGVIEVMKYVSCPVG